MGTATTPRHRADVPRTAAWADLRRSAARLLAGRDLYADDLVLRQRPPDDLGDDGLWTDLQPSPRVARQNA